MAFDRTQPQNTTKLRDVGNVIRPNWQAIELAESSFQPEAINFTDRIVVGVPDNPVAITDAFISYCKTDSAGNSEFFGIDESSNVIQYSFGGRLGSETTNLTVGNINFDTNTVNYGHNNIIQAYGEFDKDGVTIVASGCTIAYVSTGVYRITFSVALPNSNYVAVATAANEGSARICKIGKVDNTNFTVNIINEDTAPRDTGAYFMVCGGF